MQQWQMLGQGGEHQGGEGVAALRVLVYAAVHCHPAQEVCT